MSTGETLWMEDDAPVPDKERLAAAYFRLTGQHYRHEDAIEKEDAGDGDFLLMPTGLIVFSSYPGNSAIYEKGTA